MRGMLGLCVVVLLALQGPASAQFLKNLMDKAGAAAPAKTTDTGPANQGQIDSLAEKVKACNKLDKSGMMKCAQALGPTVADLAMKAANSGALGTQIKALSASVSSMSQGNKVSSN